MIKHTLHTILALAIVLAGTYAWADTVTIPNTFTSGTPAVAAEVNANFDAVKAEVDDNAGDIADNSAALMGLAANDLVRASYTSGITHIDNFDSTSFTSILSNSTVEAPVDGILLIWANLHAEWDLNNPAGTWAAVAAQISVDSTLVGVSMRQGFSDLPYSDDSNAYGLTVAAPVTAGTHTVDLEIRREFGTAMVYVFSRSLTTLFVPFGNDGVLGNLSLPSRTTSNNQAPQSQEDNE